MNCPGGGSVSPSSPWLHAVHPLYDQSRSDVALEVGEGNKIHFLY